MENNGAFLLLMIFLHIVDDFYLQGKLAELKQLKWWISQFDKYEDFLKYRNDYKIALMIHAFSWTFMIMLPISILFYGTLDWKYYLVFEINWMIHVIVDDLKANKLKINLITDQTIHLIQIIITWALFFL